MQVSAIPIGTIRYQPVTAAPAVAPVRGRPGEDEDAGARLRAAQPPGIGELLDIEA